MSLTAKLRDRESWARRFLDERFSLLGRFVRHIGGDVKSLLAKVAPRSNSGVANARSARHWISA